jgi:hypothetical protein
MSEVPVWTISMDADDDHSFGEGGENIAAYVLEAEITRGMFDELVRVAEPAKCVLTVNDTSRLFSPEAAGVGAVLAGRGVRVAATYNAVTYNLFTGQIDHIEADEQDYHSKIICYGRWKYADGKIDVAPYPGPVRVDEILLDILDEGFFRLGLTATSGDTYLMLDYSHLDSTKIAPEVSDSAGYRSLDVGKTSLTYVGQEYDRPTLREVVTDLVQAEWGWFYEQADGKLTFANRHHLLTTPTVADVSWTGAEVADDYLHSSQIYNEIYLDLIANVVLTNQALWTSVAPIRFKPGESRRIIRFLAGDGRLQAVESDFSAHSFVFKDAATSGNVVAPVVVLEPLSTGAQLYVRNDATYPIYLQIGASITGDALIKEVPQRQSAVQVESRSRYGIHPLTLKLPSFADMVPAEDLVDFLIGQYAFPRGRVVSVTLQNDTAAHLIQQLGLEILAWANVALTHLEHTADYGIIGIKQHLKQGGMVLTTDFFLTPRPRFWQLSNGTTLYLETSKLDISTVLGY